LNIRAAILGGPDFCPGRPAGLTEAGVFLDRQLGLPAMEWTPPMLRSYQFVKAAIVGDSA